MRTKPLVGAIAAAMLLALPAGAAFADDHDTAEVVVVHGVPGLEADVLVNGETSDLAGLNYGDAAVVDLPAGSYDIGVAAAGSTDAILDASATLDAGSSYSVVAHLDTDGDPVLGLFVNETGASGIQPFHVANFPAVSIIAGGEIALDGVENGQTARIDATGTVPGVGIGVAGSSDAAIDLGDVDVPAGTLILAYAIGPDEGAELPEVEVVAVDVEEAPHSVPAGSAGLAAAGMPPMVFALMVLGLAAVALPVAATARSRR